jgi:hypothetical protein
MSSLEFTESLAFYLAEPWGFEVENFRFGTLTAAVVNQVAATIPKQPGATRKSAKPTDYYPESSKTKNRQPQLTREQKAYIERKRKQRKQKQNG